MSRAVIVGVGMTSFGRHPDTHFTDLAADAIEMALADAGMDFREIQQAFCSKVYLPSATGARVMERMGRTGISCPDVEGACGAAAAGLRLAVSMVETGQYDVVLAFGVEKMPKGFMPPGQLYDDWQCMMGLTQNPQYWALNAKRHMYEYGTTEEQIAKIAAKAKRNGALNPNALFRTPMSVEQILASPLVVDPLRLFMSSETRRSGGLCACGFAVSITQCEFVLHDTDEQSDRLCDGCKEGLRACRTRPRGYRRR
jgi:acetyl-CoA C-acetyltransferase